MRKTLLALMCSAIVATSVAQKSSGPIRMMFTDTDASQVLRAISLRSGANIVYANTAKVPISINLTANSVEEAVRSTAASAGLIYRKVGGTFIVSTPAGMKQALEPYGYHVTYTVPEGDAAKIVPILTDSLPYATARAVGNKVDFIGLMEDVRSANGIVKDYVQHDAENKPVTDVAVVSSASPTEIAKLISSLYPSLKTTATGDDKSRGGAIGLSGPESDVIAAKKTIDRLDAPSAIGDSRIVYRVYKLKYTSAPVLTDFLKTAAPEVEAFMGPEPYAPPRAQFNPLTSTLKSAVGGSSGQSSTATTTQQQQQQIPGQVAAKVGDKATVVVIKGPEAAVEAALTLVQSIDVKPKQVVVDVKVVETSPSFSENIGMQYSWTPFRFFETPPGTQITGTNGGINLTDFPTNPVGFGQFSKAPWTFLGNLNALVTHGEAKVLANPSVEVTDNNDASIFVGDTIRARIVQVGALGATNVDIEEFPVGIILLIHPRVNADGDITMHVNPVVSTVTAIDADNIPQTSSREAETTLIVKSGETIVLGGLIQDQYSKTISEVPFLSQLPIVGQLFRNRNTQKKRTDVVVTITPHLVVDKDTKEPSK